MIRFISVSIFVLLAEVVSSTEEQSTCTLIKRPEPFPLNNTHTDWESKNVLYVPPDWTVPCEKEICDIKRPEHINFGEVRDGVDRRRAKSCFIRPKYKVNKLGRPLNPAGRTGIAGRGELPKWGPNHLVKLMLHRKDHGRDYIFQDGNKFPEIFVNSPSSNWFDKETEERLLGRMKHGYGSSAEAEKTIRKIEKKSKKLLRGSIPHPKNTDNAWIELHIRFVECRDHETFCQAITTEFDGRGFQWTLVNKTSSAEKKLKWKLSDMDYDMVSRYSAFCKLLMKHNAVTEAPRRFGGAFTLNGLTIGAAAIALFAIGGSVLIPVFLYILVSIGILSLILITGHGVLRGTCS